MPKRLVHFTFICFFLTAFTGVWMRLYFISNKFHLLSFDYLLHAHSHIAILGWTFLAVFIIFLSLNWQKVTNKRHAILLSTTIFIVTLAMFIAFLYEGYATYSIIFSTMHIFVEYWTILFILIHIGQNNSIPKISKLFLKGGLITLAVSSLGPFGLGALAANQLRDSPFFDMAIYFYLHFQYNGWLYLMLIGLFSHILIIRGFDLRIKWLQISFWIYFAALFPGVFLSILWYDFGFIGMPLAVVGAIGQLIGVSIFCIIIFKQGKMFKEKFTNIINFSLMIAIGFLLIKSVMELGLLSPYLAEIVYDTRSVVIGYLHLTLLGFVSIFILAQFQIIGIIDSSRKIIITGLATFFIGLILNELVLFLSGLFSWLKLAAFPFETYFLLIASLILLVGICMIWLGKSNKAR